MKRSTILMITGCLLIFGALVTGAISWGLPVMTDQHQTCLYRVAVDNHDDAKALALTGADAFATISDGYLVLVDRIQTTRLESSGLSADLIAANVTRANIMTDTKDTPHQIDRYPLIFNDGGLRLYRIPFDEIERARMEYRMKHLRTEYLTIRHRPTVSIGITEKTSVGLDSLLGLVSQDSIEAYSHKVETFGHRWCGTPGNFLCGNWLFGKFISFGYDSVFIHNFKRSGITGRNVVAVKPGTVYPEHHIIVGGHYDSGSDAYGYAPGADDNGSGTMGVLEIARVLSDIDTKMTIVFICFDAEEEYMVGSEAYAADAAAEDREIVLVLNLDMIAHEENDQEAWAFYYDNDVYAQLWTQLAAVIPGINITGHVSDSMGGLSDQAPFAFLGYDVLFSMEYIFSTHYHASHDSTTYLNYDYLTRMINASLATTYVTDSTVIPPPKLVINTIEPHRAIFKPGIDDSMTVSVNRLASADIVPGSVMFHYAIDGGEFQSLPMNAIGGDLFTIDVPAFDCGSNIEYYFSADEPVSGTFWKPAPDRPYSAYVATEVIVVIDDDFGTDQGWTVSGDATYGYWERNKDPWSPPDDYDGNLWCYETQYGQSLDVDNGETVLKSPALDIPEGDAWLTSAIYFRNDWGIDPFTDVFKAGLYQASVFHLLQTIGPTDYPVGEWKLYAWQLNEHFTYGTPLQLAYIAADTGRDTFVEGGVDAVNVSVYSYRPNIVPMSPPTAYYGTPYSHRMQAATCSAALSWTDKNGDLAGTGLTLSADGVLSGTPLVYGQVGFVALVEDTETNADEQPFTVPISVLQTCGDGNGDEAVNIADAVYLINYVFNGGPEPDPLCTGDADGDDDINISDAVYIINYVFKGGPQPVENCCP